MRIGVVIRWILSAAIICGIYVETGIWTTIFAVLITIEIELGEYVKRRDAE